MRISCQVIGGLFLVITSSSLWAQDVFESEDLRTRDEALFKAKVRLTNYFDARVEGQQKELGFVEEEASLSVDAWKDVHNRLTLLATLRQEEIDSGAVLPDTGESFPRELWDVRFGTLYRYRFDDGWMVGGLARFGSASDHPFANGDVLVGDATVFLRVPASGRDSWLFFLNWSNNRDILNNYPVPAFEYWYEPSDAFSAILGIPFISVEAHPAPEVDLLASYLIPRTVHLLGSYKPLDLVEVYLGYDWRNERYLREDRVHRDDRLFYQEMRARAGLLFHLFPHVLIDLTGGYSFKRSYYEGTKVEDDTFNRIDLGGGFFAWIGLELSLGGEKDAAEIEREKREGIRR